MTYTFESTAYTSKRPDDKPQIKKLTVTNVPDDTDMENIGYLKKEMTDAIKRIYKRKGLCTAFLGLLLISSYVSFIVSMGYEQWFALHPFTIPFIITAIIILVMTGYCISYTLWPETVPRRLGDKIASQIIQGPQYDRYEKFIKIYGHRYRRTDPEWNLRTLEDLDRLLYYGNAFKTIQDMLDVEQIIKIEITQYYEYGIDIVCDFTKDGENIDKYYLKFGMDFKKLIPRLHMNEGEKAYDLAADILYEPYS